ncbi:hypothetical protein LXL04_016860 [Taraxacum kok-saghyz]
MINGPPDAMTKKSTARRTGGIQTGKTCTTTEDTAYTRRSCAELVGAVKPRCLTLQRVRFEPQTSHKGDSGLTARLQDHWLKNGFLKKIKKSSDPTNLSSYKSPSPSADGHNLSSPYRPLHLKIFHSIAKQAKCLCLHSRRRHQCTKPFSSRFPISSSLPSLSLSSTLPPIQLPRRFSKFPIIPLTKNAVINHHHFATPESHSDWLRPRLPSDSFADWGTRPNTKNIHNLWIELYEGETSLADSIPPVRTV